MTFSRRSAPALFTLVIFTLVALGASCDAASAKRSPRLVVSSPTKKPVLAGKIAIRARLKTSKRMHVRCARFYVNGKRVTTDCRYPFKVKRGVKFDTRKLPTLKPYLKLVVKYEKRRKNRKIAKRTLKKRIRVAFITEGSNVNSKGVVLCSNSPTPAPTRHGYPLAFSDDFACGTTLDTSKWNTGRYDTHDHRPADDPAPFSRPFNGEEGAAYGPDNVSVTDGALNLTLLETPAPRAPAELTKSTGMVNSNNNFAFKYGYVETRAYVPGCFGCWPAFWIMPSENDDWPPEIDIFEYFNLSAWWENFPSSVFHWAPDGPEGDDQYEHHPQGKEAPDPPQEWFVTKPAGTTGNFMNQWHTYGMLWTSDYVEIYFDGVLGARVDGASKIPQQAMYLIYQMAIYKDDAAFSPAGTTMKIDYLHVYSNNT